MEVKRIFDKYENFGDAEKDLKALLDTENKFNNALYIIRRLCVIVTSAKTPYSKSQIEGLKNISRLSSQAIVQNKVGDVLEVNNNLSAAMYHIARVILETDDYVSFIETVGAFVEVLECMPASGDTKQIHTLTQLSILVYKSFQKLQEYLSAEKHVSVESELLKFWELMLRVSNLSRQQLFLVFQLARHTITFYSKRVSDGKQLVNLKDKVILSLKHFFCKSEKNELEDPCMSKLFKSSLSAVLVFFQTFTAMADYESAVTVVKDMIQILKPIFPASSQESKAVVVFEKVLSPFLFSFKTTPNGLSQSEINEVVKIMEGAHTGSTPESESIEWGASSISSMLVSLKQYWAKDIGKAKLVFPLSVMPALEELFSKLAMIVKKGCRSVCVNSSNQRCSLEADVPNAFYLEQTLIFLAARVVHWDAESQPLLLKVCENSFKRSEELLRIASEKNCFQSTDMAFYLCENMYLAAINGQSDYSACKDLLERSKALYLTVSKTTEVALLPRKSIAKSIMKAMSGALRRLNEKSPACRAMAVAVALDRPSPQQDDTYSLKLWSELVVELPDEGTSLLTLLKTISELKDFFIDYNENTLNWAELFVWEMVALGSYGPHKSAKLLESWKTKKGLSLSPLQEIKCAAYFLRALAFSEDLDAIKEFISDFKAEKYHDLLKVVSSNDRPVALCGLAELSYFRFFVAKRLHQTVSKEHVEKAKSFEPTPKVILSVVDVVNTNDSCELTPTFPNLVISKEVSLLTILDAALRYWEESLKKGLVASSLSTREQDNSAQYLAESAMFCRLCGHYLKEKRAWEICRSFGERLGNDRLMLRAISGLIDLSCCDLAWVQRGKAIAATLENEPATKDVLHIFKHSMIVQCLVNEKEEEAVSLLKEVLQTNDTRSWYYLKSRLLLGKILFDTPRSKQKSLFPEERKTPLSIIRYCFLQTKNLIEKKTIGGSKYGSDRFCVIDQYAVADLFFSLCLWLGYSYLEMMFPREARCFVKCVLPVSQKFGLSVRTAECLSLLGKVDLLVQKVEDGAAKMEGIKHILEVYPSEKEEPTVEIPVYQDEKDLRVRANDGNQLGASPTLPIDSSSMPEFVSHSFSCSCYYCSHVLLHKMWLDMCYIQAWLCTSQFQVNLATNFFCNGIKLADKCRRKQDKLLNGFAGRSTLLEDFCRSDTTLRLKYADLLTLYSKDTEAWKVNERIVASLKRSQVKDYMLLTDVEEQKISLIDIANPLSLSRGNAAHQTMEPSPKNGSTGFDLTPDVGLCKRFSNLATLKTPVANHRQKEGSRTPLQAITPQSIVPIKEKCFKSHRGVVPPVLIFSDSDDESPFSVCKSVNAAKKKPMRTTKEKKGLSAKSVSGIAKVKLELSDSEDIIEPADSKDTLHIQTPEFLTPAVKVSRTYKRFPREASQPSNGAASGSVNEIQIVAHEVRGTANEVKDVPKTDKRKTRAKKGSADKISISSNTVNERQIIAREVKETPPEVKDMQKVDKPKTRVKNGSADKISTSSKPGRSTRARKFV